MTRIDQMRGWSRNLLKGLRDYFGSLGRKRGNEPVNDRASMKRFLETRSSYIAQTSLYGYLRTRAGMIYPQLFENDDFVRSVNIAKWHVWLACLSDLSIYTGGLLAQRVPPSDVATFMETLVDAILAETGTPAEADAEFPLHAERVRGRLASCDWRDVTDDETPFSTSTSALIQWAPIVEDLKELDEEIVRNSVRFRWQEVRRDLRNNLDIDTLMNDRP